MVAAVHFYATESDQHALLDYLGEPDTVSLHPWPVIGPTIERLDRATALRTAQVMVAHADFGPPVGVRPASDGWASDIRAQVFNTLNWDRLRPAEDEALVDSNASPSSSGSRPLSPTVFCASATSDRRPIPWQLCRPTTSAG